MVPWWCSDTALGHPVTDNWLLTSKHHPLQILACRWSVASDQRLRRLLISNLPFCRIRTAARLDRVSCRLSSYETWDVYLLRLVAVRSQDICAYAKYIMTMMAPNRTHRPRTSLYYKIGFIHDSKRRDRVSHPYHYQRCRLTGPATKHKTRTTMKGYH